MMHVFRFMWPAAIVPFAALPFNVCADTLQDAAHQERLRFERLVAAPAFAQRFAERAGAPAGGCGLAPDTLTVGADFDRPDGGGSDWSTPFEFDLKCQNNALSFNLLGSGYGWSHPAGGDTQSGFNDVTVIVNDRLRKLDPKDKTGTDFLDVGFGYNVAAHGEVGSDSGSVLGRLRLQAYLNDRWSLSAAGIVSILDHASSGGHLADTIKATIAYDFDEKGSTSAQLSAERDHTTSSGDVNSLWLAITWPFGDSNYSGSLTFNRGLTSGARDSGAEFDLGYQF